MVQTSVALEAGIARSVRAILAVPERDIDHGSAKLALDALVDPSLDSGAAMADLDRMADRARDLAGPGAAEGARLGAVRRLIYDSGPWNGHRPFGYDHGDPLGTAIPGKLIANYLERRLGNCVSMPVLFLILAEKLGVALRLASAPHHMFLRYLAPDGTVINIEATSGGHPARDIWYRRNFPMSDRALASGLYMRTLSRREGLALMATTVLEHLLVSRRYEEAIAVATVILEHNPRDGQVMVAQASAYAGLIRTRFAARYPMPILIPEALRPGYWLLQQRNNALFAAAEALGWEPDGDFEPPPQSPGFARQAQPACNHPEESPC